MVCTCPSITILCSFIRLLSRIADKLLLPAIICGYRNVPAVIWSLDDVSSLPNLPHLEDIAIISGHFQWGVWSQLPSYQDTTPASSSYKAVDVSVNTEPQNTILPSAWSLAPPPCFIMYRHPVSRVISYYYRRVYSDIVPSFHRTLNEWSPHDLRHLLTSIRHPTTLLNGRVVISDEGMSDAACRAVSGKRVMTGKAYRPDEGMPLPPPLDQSDTDEALENCRKCIVGIQEDMNSTLAVLRHWFPWMREALEDIPPVVNQGHHGDIAENMEHLRPEIRAVIEEMNTCDMELYNVALEQFARQMIVMNS